MVMPNLREILVSASILFLTLFGGAQFYLVPWGVWFVLGMMLVIALGLLIKPPLNPPQEGGSGPVLPPAGGVRGGAFLIFFPIFVAILISNAANLDIFPATVSRTILFFAFLIIILGAHNLLNRSDVFNGLTLAGALWPGLYLLARLSGWADNTNIIAAWSVIFVAVSLAGRNWFILMGHIIMLIYLDCQGAILGSIVVAGIMIYPYLRLNIMAIVVTGSGIVAGMIAWKPVSAQCRWYYWWQAGLVFLSRPIFGVGPGGIYTRQLINEVGNGYHQNHTHNILVTTVTELGLIGLAAIMIMIFLLTRFRWQLTRWQLAAVAGVLAHSMVDEPLWWPGPLLAVAMIIGSLGVSQKM
jgi:hypothetical protein